MFRYDGATWAGFKLCAPLRGMRKVVSKLARYGLSIEKSTSFRGFQQPFANVYHYKALTGADESDAGLDALVNAVVAKEKTFHASVINFQRARLWITGTGNQQTNVMRIDKPLSGSGALTMVTGLDKERAHLFRWRAGVNTRGLPVYLRKWYHSLAPIGGVTISTDIMANVAGFTDAQRDTMESVIEELGEMVVPGVGGFRLVSQTGREWTQAVQCHKYLEHHQLGDQWR